MFIVEVTIWIHFNWALESLQLNIKQIFYERDIVDRSRLATTSWEVNKCIFLRLFPLDFINMHCLHLFCIFLGRRKIDYLYSSIISHCIARKCLDFVGSRRIQGDKSMDKWFTKSNSENSYIRI